jgi:hypothetical protein
MLENWQEKGQGPRDSILSFVHIVIINQAKIMAFGCPVGTLCSELGKLDHPARGRAAEIFDLFRDWLAGQFRALGAGGRAEELALHTLAWSQDVAVIASAFRDEVFFTARWPRSRPGSMDCRAFHITIDQGVPMFITLLKFAGNRTAAPKFVAAHDEWIAKGFADGVFLCVGSLTPEGAGESHMSIGKDVARRCEQDS